MFLLVTTFIVLGLLSFIIFYLATKPTRHEKLVKARLIQMGLSDEIEQEKGQAENLLIDTGDGQLAWFEQFLSRFGAYDSLKNLITQANSHSKPSKVVLVSLGLAAGGFLGTSLFAYLLIFKAVAAVIGGAAPIMLLRFQRGRRLKAFNNALPDAMDLMARALRAGHSVGSAIEVVSQEAQEPVASAFGMVYQQQNFGLPFRESLMSMAHTVESKDLQFVITAMLVQKETGGNLAEILDRTTHVIRERMRIQGEVRIKSAQGRLDWLDTLAAAHHYWCAYQFCESWL